MFLTCLKKKRLQSQSHEEMTSTKPSKHVRRKCYVDLTSMKYEKKMRWNTYRNTIIDCVYIPMLTQ